MAKAQDILEAEVHTLHVVLQIICRLVGENRLDHANLSHALHVLMDNSELQMPHLTSDGLLLYESWLQRLLKEVEKPPS